MSAVKSSPYAKMYLVSPAVYEKLLKCIDESDKAMTESLNPEAEIVEERRPSEIAVEQIHREELNPEPEIRTQVVPPKITPQMLQSALSSVKKTQPSTLPLIPEYDEEMQALEPVAQGPPITDQPILAPTLAQPIQPSPIRPATFVPNIATQQLTIQPQVALQPPTKCVNTKRGTICSISAPVLRSGRVLTAKKVFRFHCNQQNCQKSYTRRYDLKKHMLKEHGLEPEESYKRFGIEDDEEMAQQGVKRTQSTAGIQNKNPTKVSRVQSSEQTGSGCFPSWR